jgi:hypothetical protein
MRRYLQCLSENSDFHRLRESFCCTFPTKFAKLLKNIVFTPFNWGSKAEMTNATLIVALEAVLIFGGVIAFAWWQLHSIKVDQAKAAKEKAAAPNSETKDPHAPHP